MNRATICSTPIPTETMNPPIQSGDVAVGCFAWLYRTNILTSIFMPTSVHIPKPLLPAVDRKARALKISRNRLVVNVLEREVAQGLDWSPDFFDRLASPESGVEAAAEEMLENIQSQRRSKKPVDLCSMSWTRMWFRHS